MKTLNPVSFFIMTIIIIFPYIIVMIMMLRFLRVDATLTRNSNYLVENN